jgi:hypothetical protein
MKRQLATYTDLSLLVRFVGDANLKKKKTEFASCLHTNTTDLNCAFAE